METKYESVLKLAEELAEAMRYSKETYRLLYPNGQSESDLVEGLDTLIDDMSTKSTMLKSKMITLKTYEYWNDIIEAKIEVIAAIGGLDLMRQVHSALEDIEDTGYYHYPAMFDSRADGIGGWWM